MSLSRLSNGALHQLAHELQSGRQGLETPHTVGGWAPASEIPLVSDALHCLASLGLGREQAASVVRLVLEERAASDADRISAVWSGPEGVTAQTRDTAVVVRELFEAAKERVLVSSYVLYQTAQLFEPLARAMESNPLLEVKLFVTVLRESKDHRDGDQLVAEFAERFRNDWPGSRLPAVYHDPRSLVMGVGGRAVLHAKCVVVDGRRSFVTSANFTEAAQERNFELGLLADDELLARSIESQFETLIGRGLVRSVL